jgi:triosephosphate isomerase
MLVAGNWKMNGLLYDAEHLAEKLASGNIKNRNTEVIIFPPFLHISAVARIVQKCNIKTGGQNCSVAGSGANTGEISCEMLLDIGCSHVIVGHSERRSLHGETDAVVAKKYAAALDVGLTPILCVGESLEQHTSGETEEVVVRQLSSVRETVGLGGLCSGIIAYEPLWSIGTGRAALPSKVQSVHETIRSYLGDESAKTKIVYGGSLNSENSAAMFAEKDIDGGLVGGASLQAEEFLRIIKMAERL